MFGDEFGVVETAASDMVSGSRKWDDDGGTVGDGKCVIHKFG